MGDKSSIQWTNATWNPIAGCKIHSPGCKFCYAMHEAARQIRCAAGLKRETHYAGTVEVRDGRPIWTGKINAAPDRVWELPLRWRKPRMIFVNSMSDLFAENVPDDWIDRALAIMALSPQHTFQVLTKRSARMRRYFAGIEGMENCPPARWALIEGMAQAEYARLHPDEDRDAIGMTLAVHGPLSNVWLGVSTERQQEADERIPDLLATPAAIRFISAEPLIGQIDLTNHCNGHYFFDSLRGTRWHDAPGYEFAHEKFCDGIDWVIAGGESSRLAVEQPRPMHPQWARSLRDQCAAAGVPFFFKQWGDYHPALDHSDTCKATPNAIHVSGKREYRPSEEFSLVANRAEGWVGMCRLGVAKAGRILDGRTHDDLPKVPA